VNQVVVWDKIVLRNSGGDLIDLKDVHLKYPFFDDGSGLMCALLSPASGFPPSRQPTLTPLLVRCPRRGNQNVSLALHWNVIPIAGLLPRRSDGHVQIRFSDYYHE
jgi:signal peptidase complex subunit 3